MDKAANEQQFLELIQRYETITLEEIVAKVSEVTRRLNNGVDIYVEKDLGTIYYNVRNELTGFGKTSTCSLCRDPGNNEKYMCAYECIYGVLQESLCYKRTTYACTTFNIADDAGLEREPNNGNTYGAIAAAKTPRQLLDAYRNRARFMRRVWEEYQRIISIKETVMGEYDGTTEP